MSEQLSIIQKEEKDLMVLSEKDKKYFAERAKDSVKGRSVQEMAEEDALLTYDDPDYRYMSSQEESLESKKRMH